eukprot:6209083-Pleurochrysis_carterae.AAC.1
MVPDTDLQLGLDLAFPKVYSVAVNPARLHEGAQKNANITTEDGSGEGSNQSARTFLCASIDNNMLRLELCTADQQSFRTYRFQSVGKVH